jgi:hypothetical protein
MNHPTQTEWLLYLDEDVSPEEKNRLAEHLKQCPMCAAEIAGWQRSAQKLQRMPFPEAEQSRAGIRRQSLPVSSLAKWGLAAAIVLFVGIAIGRSSALRSGPQAQAVAAQVRQELRQQLQEDLLAAVDPAREAKDGFQKQLRANVEAALAHAATQNTGAYHDIMQAVQHQRQQDQQRFVALINDVREQQLSYCLALRQDLETAVSAADSDLRQNSRRISELAYTLSTPPK